MTFDHHDNSQPADSQDDLHDEVHDESEGSATSTTDDDKTRDAKLKANQRKPQKTGQEPQADESSGSTADEGGR